ncbi:hypothetical protein EMIT0232MI5_40324 [Pseudomonas sp. IT-232MI5]
MYEVSVGADEVCDLFYARKKHPIQLSETSDTPSEQISLGSSLHPPEIDSCKKTTSLTAAMFPQALTSALIAAISIPIKPKPRCHRAHSFAKRRTR